MKFSILISSILLFVLFAQVEGQNIQFTENAETLNLNNSNSTWSVNWIDFNSDSRPDIYMSNGYVGEMQANSLLLNQGFIFQETISSVGLNDEEPTSCASWFDFDNDGDLDLFTTNNSFTSGSNHFYENINDDFTDISTELNMNLTSNYTIVCTGNYNNDDYYDIFVGGIYCENILYTGSQEGFISQVLPNPEETTGSSSFADLNGDKTAELIITNSLGKILVYEFENSTFTNIANQIGLGELEKASAFSVSDIDLDEDMDLIFTVNTGTYDEAVKIYKNENGIFTISQMLNEPLTGRGKAITQFDANKDSYPDFLIGLWGDFNVLLINSEGNSFTKEIGLFSNQSFTNSLSACDLDQDGDEDIYEAVYQIEGYSSENLCWINESEIQNHFIKIKLKANRAYLNSMVKVYTDKIYIKELKGMNGSKSQNEILFFGLGENTSIDSIGINWSFQPEIERIYYLIDVDTTYLITPELITTSKRTVENITDINVFPIPFKDKFTINCYLKKPTNIILSLTDMYASENYLLFNDKLESGNHEIPINFQNGNCNEGIYILNILAEDERYFRKVILINQ